ncbi:hypothetical protein [Priestia aryabhattai]|uniref:hypothetical protein n=1 Tax=Priestia aryabhattai TaxID=412384 RepID=UPI003CA2B8B5
MRKLLERALQTRCKMEIIYIDQNNKISQRTIAVQSIEDHVVVAFCYLRNRKRLFTLENILSASLVK